MVVQQRVQLRCSSTLFKNYINRLGCRCCRARYDMSFKYFLEIAPEEDVINSSSLTKFLKLRLKDMDLSNLLINKTVSIALEKDIIKSKSIIVEATHTHSRSNPYTALEVLKERSKLLRKVIYQINEELGESAQKMK